MKLRKVISQTDGDVYVFDQIPPTPSALEEMNKAAFDKLNPDRTKPPADVTRTADKLP